MMECDDLLLDTCYFGDVIVALDGIVAVVVVVVVILEVLRKVFSYLFSYSFFV